MKHLLLSIFLLSVLSCGAQDTLYKVNTKPFLNQNSFLYNSAVKMTKVYVSKPVETKSDQSFWKLIARQEDFKYSNQTVKPFGTSKLMDNIGKPYEPLSFKITNPMGANPNPTYLSYMVLNLFLETKAFIRRK